MPYRRLPNTDKSRLRAIQQAIKGFDKLSSGQQVLSANTIYKLRLIYTEFSEAVKTYNTAFEYQIENKKVHNDKFHKCKLYLSHFIQVANFSILRGEIPKATRKYYGLSETSTNVPSLQTEKQIITWGKKIVEGEQKRLKEGKKPVENPSLPLTKAAFEAFEESAILQKNLQKRTNNTQTTLTKLRPGVDELIKQAWDEIESTFDKYPPLIKREKCKSFGIIYIYRKTEEKIELDDLLKL